MDTSRISEAEVRLSGWGLATLGTGTSAMREDLLTRGGEILFFSIFSDIFLMKGRVGLSMFSPSSTLLRLGLDAGMSIGAGGALGRAEDRCFWAFRTLRWKSRSGDGLLFLELATEFVRSESTAWLAGKRERALI